MPRYPYRCPNGHDLELSLSIHDEIPAVTECMCDETAVRIWEPPAAIHFKGRGFYATDVKGSQERRRRPNAGDRLPAIHDPEAEKIARSL